VMMAWTVGGAGGGGNLDGGGDEKFDFFSDVNVAFAVMLTR